MKTSDDERRKDGGAVIEVDFEGGGFATIRPVMQSSATPPPQPRVAFTFAEFAALFGHERSWTYRMVKARRVRALTGYGAMMIPASEVERLLGGSAEKPE